MVKKGPAPDAGGAGEGNRAAAISRAQVVRLWEDLIDEDAEVAEELFWDALLRDARDEYARRARNEQQEDRRRAHVFEPWQPVMPDTAAPPQPPQQSAVPHTAAPPPPQQQQPVVVPAVQRALVLRLRTPPHLARWHERPPSGSAAGRPPTGKKPRAV